MGMVAECAAAAALVTGPQGNPFAVGDFRVTLPGEGPHRGEGDVGGIEGNQVSDGAAAGQFQSPGAGGVIVHLQLHLTQHPGILHHLDHAVILLQVESGHLHGKHILAVLAAQLHVPVVAEVLTGDDHAVNLRVLDEHLLRGTVDGHIIAVVPKILLHFIGGAGDCHPVDFVIVMQGLIVLSDVGVGQRSNGKINLSHKQASTEV